MPERIQLSRKKGWRKPENTVVVARPTRWGNPWRVWRDPKLKRWILKADHNASSERYLTREMAIFAAVQSFAAWAWRLDASELAGKNLACWCPIGEPCHADVLLEIANRDQS